MLYNALAAIEQKNSGYTFRIVGNYNYPVEKPDIWGSVARAAIGQLSSLDEFKAAKK